jgi:hypothetical protein
MTASVNEVPASDSSVPQPTGEAHALERAAYALGCSEGLLQDVRAALWDRREAVSEARLAGESLTLAHLLAEEALLGERRTSLRSSSARRWLNALWLVREASSEAPALSGPHWHAVLSCLDSQTLTTQARASLRRWSEELRGLWARQGGLAASSMVVAPSHEAPDTGLGAQLGRLASHALLHHAGRTVDLRSETRVASPRAHGPRARWAGGAGPALRSLAFRPSGGTRGA